MDIIEVMVNMDSQFGVEQRQVAPLLVHIMNKLGGRPGSHLLRKVKGWSVLRKLSQKMVPQLVRERR